MISGFMVVQISRFDPVDQEFSDALYWQEGEKEVGKGSDEAPKKTVLSASGEKTDDATGA